MITAILEWILLGIFLYASYKYVSFRPKGFPPGPPRIPLFGSYLFMMMSDRRYLHKGVHKLAKWFKTDIVGMHMGPYPLVVVHNGAAMREVLNRSEFDGRPQLFLAKMREPNFKLAGIFFNDGPTWREQRRFLLRNLRDYGFGRRSNELEWVMQQEINDMLDLIRNGPKYEHEREFVKEGGYRVLLPYFFNPFLANSLFHVIYNERHPRSEQAVLWQLVHSGTEFQRNTDDYGKMLSIMPWVRFIFPNWSSYNQIMKSNRLLFKYFEELVERHIKTYDAACERNFLDVYIREMKKAEEEKHSDTGFTRNQFILNLMDFAMPTFSSLGIQLAFLVEYLLLYPEVQKKMQQEIDDVVGSGRLPTLDDRRYMHYCEATLREIMRMETLVASNIPHRALVDTELMGYKIPKNTLIMTSFYAHHNDKEVWGDPETFRPERFLDEMGKFNLKKDLSLPFGAGKRLCAGETFARNILFLMSTAVCQNFNIVLGPEDKLPDVSSHNSGLNISPKDFWVQLEER